MIPRKFEDSYILINTHAKYRDKFPGTFLDFGKLLSLATQLDYNKRNLLQPVEIDDYQLENLEAIVGKQNLQHCQEGIKRLVWLAEWVWEAMNDYLDMEYDIKHKDDEIEELGIDIETYSPVDLKTCGVYKYAESPEFAVILFAYSVNNGPVRLVDTGRGESLPERIERALTDPTVLKTAYNASFERICLSKYLGMPLGKYLPPDQWDCTMVRAARLGMPLSLDQCGKVLGVEKTKMKEGAALIRYFSVPCRATKANEGRTRNLPEHAPEKWEVFKKYCKRDVEVEQAILAKVRKKPVTEKERNLWIVDQKINDRGVLVDLQMAKKAQQLDDEYKAEILKEAVKLTGSDNPNSVSQLKQWLLQEEGIVVNSLNKKDLPDVMEKAQSEKAQRVLQIRTELGKTSTKKYTAMLNGACHDGRVRGLTQFYGANRTGRWSGRLLQLQNLPQNHIPDIDYARTLVKEADLEELEMNYANVPQLLSELIRTALIAKPGHTFHVCDFSAIEARVIAWVAGEQWIIDTFKAGGDIYCATASQMFGVPVEKHGQNAELRQKGKIAVLALGYQGAEGALEAMGGARMGLTKAEMTEIKDKWRLSNARIVRLWKHVENAAMCCVRTGETCEIEKGITFEWKWGGVKVTLPSKRFIFYPRMRMGEENGQPRLVYDGVNQTTKAWGPTFTYGGKMTENIVQAIARDCLAEKMLRLDAEGFPIVFHVHDEVIVEASANQTLEQIEKIFDEEITWARGLPLKGAGYSTPYYLKD